ncbi:hypothetical protein BK128_21365 [Viridibacillus sp. FSL H7-0596]|uniref:hypothetical protein n=1 Tax=Viridibacillus sp. FSL H7-0596 TaxID=1928923 RepID=UPI00096FAB7B|nr:hypothetical protein [Viridibacillus sp. FSL H7-0596]OMC81822.1 hypothetical protein BK128_21365 [Viridibacillus sp. FSL H7-0596]
MANETDLIRIHTTNKYADQSIDFGVFPTVDKLSDSQREELAQTLFLMLTKLRKNEYPFSK